MSSQNGSLPSEPKDIYTNGSNGELRNGDEVDDGGLAMKLRFATLNSLDHPVPSSPTKSSSLKRNTSYGNLMPAEAKETKVKVIYTGGTIGMVRNERNGKFEMRFFQPKEILKII